MPDNKQPCCGGKDTSKSAADSAHTKPVRSMPSTQWTFRDHLGAVLVRFSNSFRMNYRVDPGLYSLGNPTPKSPVFATANYRLSFNLLRTALIGMNAWVLVLDTKGINVWCAAGKGTFGTKELIGRIRFTDLANMVSHRRIVVPQLGAPGLASHQVAKETGFRLIFGPVLARDIPAFVDAGYKATSGMRTIRFCIIDRIKLIPLEVKPALKIAAPLALFLLALAGVNPHGFSLAVAWDKGRVLVAACGLAVGAGSILTPLLLPWIPFRAFTLKGALTGLASALLLFAKPALSAVETAFVLTAIPALSSYFAFNFTGSTTFTNPSGVKKELKIAAPLYVAPGTCGIAFLILFKIQTWRM